VKNDNYGFFQEYWAKNQRFGFKIPSSLYKEILSRCARSAPNETGGVLAGNYNEKLDCAYVLSISDPTKDSRKGGNWFYRGVFGLQKWLDHLWSRYRNYYLGEWHFHPGGRPFPSSEDIFQMQSISTSPQYHCPEPLLLIIGGTPNMMPKDFEGCIYVFQRDGEFFPLEPIITNIYP
jgi:integrative and conjugative element protein (TIGR02256 family)